MPPARKVNLETSRMNELKMITLRQRGMTSPQIAKELDMKESTVKDALFRMGQRASAKATEYVAEMKREQTASLLLVFEEAMAEWERSKRPTVTTTSLKKPPTLILRPVRGGKGSGGSRAVTPSDSPQLDLSRAELLVAEESRKIQNQCGDPRYLEQARGVLSDIRKIWGIDAPSRLALTDADGDGPATIKILRGASLDDL